jgi:hypothetical protein
VVEMWEAVEGAGGRGREEGWGASQQEGWQHVVDSRCTWLVHTCNGPKVHVRFSRLWFSLSPWVLTYISCWWRCTARNNVCACCAP